MYSYLRARNQTVDCGYVKGQLDYVNDHASMKKKL